MTMSADKIVRESTAKRECRIGICAAVTAVATFAAVVAKIVAVLPT